MSCDNSSHACYYDQAVMDCRTHNQIVNYFIEQMEDDYGKNPVRIEMNLEAIILPAVGPVARHFSSSVREYEVDLVGGNEEDPRGRVNHIRLTNLLENSPALEFLTVIGDNEGNCFPLRPPVSSLAHLKRIQFRPTTFDPLVTSINPVLIYNWVKAIPSLQEFEIFYGTNEHQKDRGRSKSEMLTAFQKLKSEGYLSRDSPIRFSFNLRFWVQEAPVLQRLQELGLIIKEFKIRLDDSCGCAEPSEKKLFGENLTALLNVQAPNLENLSLHCNVLVSRTVTLPLLPRLQKFSMKPFCVKGGDVRHIPPLQPFVPGQLPALKSLVLDGYYERQLLFTPMGKCETVEELELHRIPQETFIEKWDVIFPNLRKLELSPVSAWHLKSVAGKMLQLEELTLGTLDMNQKEMTKIIPQLKNLKKLRALDFEWCQHSWLLPLVVKLTKANVLPPLKTLSFQHMETKPDDAQREILEQLHGHVKFHVMMPRDTCKAKHGHAHHGCC